MSTPKKIRLKLKKRKLNVNAITSKNIEETYSALKPYKGSSTSELRKEISNAFNLNMKKITKEDIQMLGVIVETREHEHLSFVISNFIKCTGLNVQLYHGNGNLNFILESPIKELIDEGHVTLTSLNVNTLTERYYNSLFLSECFWESISGKGKIFVFQTDSICCENSDFKLQDFESFDYIGARWRNRLRLNGLVLDGGVGGFSIRDYSKSLECVKKFSDQNWQGGEDDFFAFHIELLGGNVGNKKECSQFCTQNEFLQKSFGAHQLSNLSSVEQLNFLTYCQESEFLF